MDKRLNRHVTKGDIVMARKQMEICKASLVTKKMQIHVTGGYHKTPIKGANIRKATDALDTIEAVGPPECSRCWWEGQMGRSNGEINRAPGFTVPYTVEHALTLDTSNSTSRHLPKRYKNLILQKEQYNNVYTLHHNRLRWEITSSPSMEWI